MPFAFGILVFISYSTSRSDDSATHAQIKASTAPVELPPQPSCPNVDFSFFQTQNVMYSSKVRHVELYMEPKAFTEKNLRSLFACISAANPEPIHLTAVLETDWSRVHIPDGSPGYGASNMPPDPHEYDFLQSTYYRRENHEYFRYSP
ncbi:MAG: hypothetical protein ACRD43_02320, partial [Pyrinomonadaceae bacterium]